MPYIERDDDGNIVAVYVRPQPGKAETKILDNDPELIAWRESNNRLNSSREQKQADARKTIRELRGKGKQVLESPAKMDRLLDALNVIINGSG